MTLPRAQATASALADKNPGQTVVVTLSPPTTPPHSDHAGQISQSSEHLLIAAGSIGEKRYSVTVSHLLTEIGATIIIVMIVLGLYTMRKRGLTIRDVVQHGKSQMRRRPVPPPKYGFDKKQFYEHSNSYSRTTLVNAPLPAASISRSVSLSRQVPLQPLKRSDRYVEIPTLLM